MDRKEDILHREFSWEEHRFQTVIKELNAAVFEWDFKENKFYSSEAYQNYVISRISNEDILNNTGSLEAVHPEDISILKHFFEETDSGKDKVETVLRLKLTNGTYRWCRMLGFFYRNTSGRPYRTMGVIIDINEEHEHQVKLQKLVDSVPVGIGIYEIHDGQLSQTFVNRAYYKMIGMSRESRSQYDGENTIKATHPEDAGTISEAIKKLMAGEDTTNVTYRVRGGDMPWFWVNLSCMVVERRENYLKVYAAFSDYNAIMQAQHELENGRITLNIALQAAKVMTWRYDYKQKRITDSGTLGETFQLPKVIDDVPQSIIDMGFIGEESKEDFFRLFDQIQTENVASVDVVSTVKNEHGTAWYKQIYTPIFDKDGNYVDAIGIAIDISDQKVREHEYQEQLRLSRAAAKGALATASYNLSQNTVTEFESSEEDLIQIMEKQTADDVLHSIREAIFDENEKIKLGQMYDCKSMLEEYDKGNTHIEFRHHLKNHIGWMQTSFDMICNPYTGDIEAIGVLRDITEMVRAELVVNRLLMVDYQAIMTIDAQNGTVIPFKDETIDQNLREIIRLQKDIGDNSAGLEAHLRKYGIPGNVEKAVRENSLENIKNQLEKMPFYENLYDLKKNGRIIHQRAIYAYLEDSKDVLLCAVQDVTDTFEEEEQQKRALSMALNEAQKANQAKTAFLSRVSHDMRTPLNGILGLTTLLKDNITDEAMRRDLIELEMSGQYLLNLINDTLDVSRIESGKLELHPSVCDGRLLFNNALSMARTSIQEKKIQFGIHAESLPFTTLYVDVERIQQVVMNILGNAVKFTPEGGKIDVFMRNLSVENGIIIDELVIQDNGVGMSKEFLPHVFEAFSQEDSTRTSSYQGTGLGMSITKQIVKVMGGDIRIESELGKGTRVTITLPMHIATDEQIREWKEKQIKASGEVNLDNVRILLCEDHQLNAIIATRLLETKGMTVERAENGAIGVKMFKDSELGYYDAILMDIRMPVMDGIDAAKVIRKLPRQDAGAIPIIAMTANAFEEDVRQTREAGMDAHLSKPIQREVLYNTLESLLKISTSPRRQKILIVDDLEINRVVIRTALEQEYDILEAEDGYQALEVLERNPGIDIIITDIQMPKMNGVELIRRLRSDRKYRHCVIIANTQYGDPGQEEELLALGIDDFIYKPTTPKILEMRVRNALHRIV